MLQKYKMVNLKTFRNYLTGNGAKQNLSYQLLPVIKFSKLCGTCPLSYNIYITRHERKAVNYFIHWKSMGVLLVVFIGIPTFGLWLLCFFNQGLSIGLTLPVKFDAALFSFNGRTISKITPFVFDAIKLFIPCFQIFDSITLWLVSASLPIILNNWNVIEDEIISAFRKFKNKKQLLFSDDEYCISNINIIGYRNFVFIIFALIPSCILIYFVVGRPAFLLTGLNEHIGLLIHVYLTLSSSVLSLFQEEKVVLMYQCIVLAFKKINSEIQDMFSLHCSSKGNCEIRREEILQWGKIILRIRKQNELTGRYQAFNQILGLGLHLSIMTGMTFLLADIITGKLDGSLFLGVLCGFSITSMARLFRQVRCASKITEEEKAVAETVFNIHEEMSDISTRMEAKLICDLLRVQPSEISFWGYITLNKSFLLSFCSQITTYLIVLTQFNSTSR